ncbi:MULTISPECIES: hypothetical protein [Brevibacillus]|jgi:hypothetical protein|nr:MULTISPECIES: hypothetical protein [Brevibacillus]MBU8716308.1 hypothetical protein [Brevibacillus parabrevis]MED2255274.1 hypothetical protein [Brevibacillus parabrevis]UED70070.1 hypothetical protein HP435_05325 [Brevibacillus sp. HD3.3A]WDV96368.1 hypothetical protein PSE45_05240 [Brevibacillus parabrevis]
MKRYVWTLFGAVIVAGISLATWAGASNQGNKEALNAYKKMEQARNQENKFLNESSNNFTLSDFSIPGALLSEADKISKYKGSNVHELLTAHDEKLSFIMEGDEVKGIAIATDTEPIMAGGEKTGPELFDLHEKIKNDLGDNVNIMYFSYAGGFVFVATDNKGEESLWLDQRAAQFLELSPHVQLDSEEVLQRIRNNINQ